MGLMVKVFEVINSDGECMPPFTFLRNEPKHFKTSASSEHLLMFQVAVSEKVKLIGSLKTEGAVLLPGRMFAVILEDDTIKATPFFCRTFARSSYGTNALPVPPSSKKKKPSFRTRQKWYCKPRP